LNNKVTTSFYLDNLNFMPGVLPVLPVFLAILYWPCCRFFFWQQKSISWKIYLFVRLLLYFKYWSDI